MHQVTRIISAIQKGDAAAGQELLPLVYDELRKLAAQKVPLLWLGQVLLYITMLIGLVAPRCISSRGFAGPAVVDHPHDLIRDSWRRVAR